MVKLEVKIYMNCVALRKLNNTASVNIIILFIIILLSLSDVWRHGDVINGDGTGVNRLV